MSRIHWIDVIISWFSIIFTGIWWIFHNSACCQQEFPSVKKKPRPHFATLSQLASCGRTPASHALRRRHHTMSWNPFWISIYIFTFWRDLSLICIISRWITCSSGKILNLRFFSPNIYIFCNWEKSLIGQHFCTIRKVFWSTFFLPLKKCFLSLSSWKILYRKW